MTGLKIRILAKLQIMELLAEDDVTAIFPVSTSRFGLGEEGESYKTPRGRFRICSKIGAGNPVTTVYKGRVPIPEPVDWENESDLITCRILWLDGLEPRNANSRERFIYIHGTNEEHLIGQPASHGCVRMRNADIAHLFDLVPEGTEVEILE